MAVKRILIIGARSPVALELARAFDRENHKVILVDSQIFPLARWSNAAQFIRIASPRLQFQQFRKDIQHLVKQERITDVVPTYEETFYLAQCMDNLPCKVWTSDIHLLKKLHNKLSFIDMAADFFDCPNTNTVTEDDFSNSKDLVFKAKFSRFSSGLLVRPTNIAAQKVIKIKEDWIAQEYIEGKELCVYSLWDSGKMKSISIYHPLFRAGKGAGIYFLPVDIPEVEQKVREFGQALSFHGQLSFDFIERKDKYYVIECNPRTTSGVHLQSETIAKSFFGSSQKNTTTVPKAIKLLVFLKNPLICFSKKWKVARDVIYDKQDKLPVFLQLVGVFETLYYAVIRGIHPLKATTFDIQWDGEIHDVLA